MRVMQKKRKIVVAKENSLIEDFREGRRLLGEELKGKRDRKHTLLLGTKTLAGWPVGGEGAPRWTSRREGREAKGGPGIFGGGELEEGEERGRSVCYSFREEEGKKDKGREKKNRPKRRRECVRGGNGWTKKGNTRNDEKRKRRSWLSPRGDEEK